MSQTLEYREIYKQILAAPYFVSLIFRWLIPFIIRKQAYPSQNKSKDNCIKRIFAKNENFKVPYVSIITVFTRLAILAILVNFSLKLCNVISWSYYIILWPYYVFIGMSLILSCGTLLLLFNWLCTKINKENDDQSNENS